MSAYGMRTAANPRPRNRPARYVVAVIIGAVVLLVVAGNSLLDYVFIDSIPGRATLYGLVAVALIAVGTYIQARAFNCDPVTRRRHLIRAGVLLGLAAMLWLLISDLFLFAQSAGPGVAAVCALACVPTTAFGLWVVRRIDRNEKEPWRLVLVAAAWGAVVATSLVIWAESLWQDIATRPLVPGPGDERANGDVLPEALSPDDEARGHDRAPRRRDQDEAPGFFFVAIHPADDPQPERGRGQAGERAHRRHLGARRAREYEDVDQQQPQQCREAQEHCRADEVAPAHGWVAGRGAHPDEGAHRDQSDGQQSIERRAAGDGVEVDVVKDRARDQHEAEHNCDRDRDRIACRPARTRIRAPSRGEGAHYLSTKTTRRPITSTGRPPS